CARSKNGPHRQIRRNAGVRYRGGARQSVGRGTDTGADTLCGQPEHCTDRTTPRYSPAAAHHPLDHPDRRRRGLPAGGARRILADMAEVEEAIADQGVPRGRLRVSAALGHGRLAIVPLVAAFSARYPHITVDLSLSDEVVDILGGQADVAVRFGPLPDSPLTARRIGETGQVVVASPDYLQRHGTPQQPEDLLEHNCLRFNFRRAEPNWPFVRNGELFSLKVCGNIECSSG